MNYTPPCSLNYSNQKNQEEKIDFAPTKRNIVIKNSFVQDENELKVEVLVLMQYLNFVGEYRTFVDWEEVENVIVDDFIKLDSFIHEIKWLVVRESGDDSTIGIIRKLLIFLPLFSFFIGLYSQITEQINSNWF